MKMLQKKLRDRSGASILLALLFFLLCGMVGASILMAASSNAGKTRSNRAEQQKYLLLSSALRLVCDELSSAKYIGRYTYEKTIVPVTIGTEADSVVENHTHHTFQQIIGDFQCGLAGLLPLTHELDLLFAEKFPVSYVNERNHYDYERLSGTFASVQYELTLTLTLPEEMSGLGGAPVTVLVWLDPDLRIRVTASMETDGFVYTMEAQLVGKGGAPGFTDAIDTGPGEVTSTEKEAAPLEWTLEWIAKKEAGNVS